MCSVAGGKLSSGALALYLLEVIVQIGALGPGGITYLSSIRRSVKSQGRWVDVSLPISVFIHCFCIPFAEGMNNFVAVHSQIKGRYGLLPVFQASTMGLDGSSHYSVELDGLVGSLRNTGKIVLPHESASPRA